MKKILFIFPFLLLFALCHAQIITSNPVYHVTSTSAGGYDADYQAVYDVMTTKPTVYDDAQDTLVRELKTAGVWAKADIVYVPATEVNTASEALINWVSPGTWNATNVHATAWAQYEGFTGDGGSDVIGTNFNPSTAGGKYTQNSAAIAIYLRLDKDEAKQDYGLYAGGTFIALFARTANDGVFLSNSTTSNTTTGDAVPNGQGLFTVSRTSSTAVELYRNATSLYTGTRTSETLLNANIYILGQSEASSSKCTNQFSFFFLGSGLTDQEVIDMNTAVEKYMDRIGKGVE